MRTIYTLSFLLGALVLAPMSLFAAADTPEPATFGLMGLAVVGLIAARAKFRRR
jgi:MYXO-CTERM domain-containing protein